jgi:uncharacterized protein
MSFARRLENDFYRRVRHPGAASVAYGDAESWRPAVLQGHKYCLLTSYRRTGSAVSTPVWFGSDGDTIYIRSGPEDGKIKRIRRNPEVLVSPCGARGRPIGRPMKASARILDRESEQAHAESVLRSSYGLGRRLYRWLGRRTTAAYLEVSGSPTR